MLKEDFSKHLTDTLGVNLEQLKEAITSEKEVEVTYKTGMLMDDETLTTLKEDVKKQGYNEGKVAGVEMAIKLGKEKFGLEFEGKTIENFGESLKIKTLSDAKVPADKKVKELSTSLETLQGKYETDISLKENEITKIKTEFKNVQIQSVIQSQVPKEVVAVKPSQFAALVSMEYSFDYNEDDVLVVSKNGKLLKDNLEKPIPIPDVLTTFAKTNGWLDAEGRGGGDAGEGGSNGFKTMNEVYKHMEENEINPMSNKGKQLITDFETKNN